MSVQLVCSKCGKVMKAADDAVDKEVKCPECGTLNLVADPSFERAALKRLDRLNRTASEIDGKLWWILCLVVLAALGSCSSAIVVMQQRH